MFFGLDVTDEQKEYIDSIFKNRLTIVNARAGTGKTQIAVATAKLLKRDLYYVFPTVEENALGHTPGTETEKEKKYIQPLLDALGKIREDVRFCIDNEELAEHLRKQAWVYPKSHNFMRGRNFENITVIIDEAQNLTLSELVKVTTRLHDTCKVVVIGHDGQCDIPKNKSGFKAYREYFEKKHYCKVINLTHNFRGELAQDADELLELHS